MTTLEDVLLLAHILAAMTWLGGVVVIGAFVRRAVADDDPASITRLVGSLRVIGPRVLAPAPAVVLGAGLWLALESDAWSFDQLWLQLALGLFAVAFLIGAAHQSRAALAANRAAEGGEPERAAAHLRRWVRGNGLILLLLVATTAVMVVKPGL